MREKLTINMSTFQSFRDIQVNIFLITLRKQMLWVLIISSLVTSSKEYICRTYVFYARKSILLGGLVQNYAFLSNG